MLEDSLFDSLGRKKTRKPVTVCVSVVLHVVLVAVLALIPLAQTHAVPALPVDIGLMAPGLEPAKAPEIVTVAPRIQAQIPLDPETIYTPLSIPDDIAMVVDAPLPARAV